MTPQSSLGFSTVEFSRDVLGVGPLPWQRWLLIHALELRPDGRFRFRTVLVLVARQNGKTTTVEIKNLWKMFVLRVPMVIGTAQNLDISEESWDKAVEIVESIPELNAEVVHVDRTNGKKTLRLAHGSRWKIAAASRRGGRGLAGDDVNLDELREHQTWDSWAAVTKTTMARANAQVWAYSNAGDSRSVVLKDLQDKGRAAAENPADLSVFLAEWSAPDHIRCTCSRSNGVHRDDCLLWDREAWAQANPSLGYTITEDAIASAVLTDPVDVFRTEVLCQRVDRVADRWQVISEDDYTGLLDPGSRAVDPVVFAIDVTPERSYSSIAAVGARADGDLHGELVAHWPGTSWLLERAVHLNTAWRPARWVLDPAGAAGFLLPQLQAAGLDVLVLTSRQVGQAFGLFRSATSSQEQTVVEPAGEMLTGSPGGDPVEVLPVPRLHIFADPEHGGQRTAALASAVEGAAVRRIGDASTWDRRTAQTVISPVVALTNALFGFVTWVPEPPPAVWAMRG